MGSHSSKAISIAAIHVSKVKQGSEKLVWVPLIRPSSVRPKAVHPSLLGMFIMEPAGYGNNGYREEDNTRVYNRSLKIY